MPLLRYRALTRSGTREGGIIDAPTPSAALDMLRARGLVVLDVDPAESRTGFFAARTRSADLAEFTRALAALLPAGLSLPRALSVAQDMAPPRLRSAVAQVQSQVERGSTFADALAAHPNVFPASYTGLIRAGERAGNLDESVSRLADAVESDESFRAKLLTAAIYPILLAFVGGAAILVLLLVVLPRFGALFTASGTALPTSTAIVLGTSAFLSRNAGAALVLAALATAFTLWLATADGAAEARSRLFLSTPVVSAFYREVLAARTARIISILLGGGAPFVSALDDAGKSVEDPAAQREIQRIRARAREGMSPSAAIAEGTLFPPVLSRLVAAGEESSQLGAFFAKAADLFEERAQRSAARFVALAEPALIVAFGIIVGLIALALVQAIYGINVAPMRGAR